MQRLVSLSHTLSFFTFPCRVRPTGKDFVTKLTCLKTDKKSPAAGCAAWQETRCPKGIWGRLAPGASLAPAAGIVVVLATATIGTARSREAATGIVVVVATAAVGTRIALALAAGIVVVGPSPGVRAACARQTPALVVGSGPSVQPPARGPDVTAMTVVVTRATAVEALPARSSGTALGIVVARGFGKGWIRKDKAKDQAKASRNEMDVGYLDHAALLLKHRIEGKGHPAAPILPVSSSWAKPEKFSDPHLCGPKRIFLNPCLSTTVKGHNFSFVFNVLQGCLCAIHKDIPSPSLLSEKSSQKASTLLWIGTNFPVYASKKCASVHFDTCCSPFLVARGTQQCSSPSALSGKQESKRLTRLRTGSTQRERWPPQPMRGPCCKKKNVSATQDVF